MLKTLHVRDFRGIETLDVEDLGRVNLLIGRNEAGKTTLMEAAALAALGPAGIPLLDGRKLSAGMANPLLYLMREGPGVARFEVWGTRSLKGAEVSRLVGTEGPAHVLVLHWEGKEYPIGWRAGVAVSDELAHAVRPTPDPQWANQSEGSLRGAIFNFAELYRDGRESEITKTLAPVAAGLESLDLIGEDIWYKLAHLRPRLPLTTLGEGALWLFDIAVCIATAREICCLDELDAGLHPTSLVQALRLVQASPPDLQTFATTHSDECIRAACETFREADDAGLRVIRLDRNGSTHRASVYDRDAALLALDNGWEIRG